jgi:hypothetical protein
LVHPVFLQGWRRFWAEFRVAKKSPLLLPVIQLETVRNFYL